MQRVSVIIAILFIRYVIFEPSAAHTKQSAVKPIVKLTKTSRKKASSNPLPPHLKPLYNLPAHPSLLPAPANESATWLSYLVAQAVLSYRHLVWSSPGKEHGGREWIEEILNRSKTNNGASEDGFISLDRVDVKDVELGERTPNISGAKVVECDEKDGRVKVHLFVSYQDRVSISLETKVIMNFPRPRFAVLPVELSLNLVEFQGTLSLEITPPMNAPSATITPKNTPTHHGPTVKVSLLPDFQLSLISRSLLGSKAKLMDIPKVEQLIIGRIRSVIVDRYVNSSITIGLPFPAPTSPLSTPSSTSSDIGDEDNLPESDYVMIRPPPSPNPDSVPPSSDDVEDQGYPEADVDPSLYEYSSAFLGGRNVGLGLGMTSSLASLDSVGVGRGPYRPRRNLSVPSMSASTPNLSVSPGGRSKDRKKREKDRKEELRLPGAYASRLSKRLPRANDGEEEGERTWMATGKGLGYVNQ